MTIQAGQLIDALSCSLFALLGLWAAVVRRHWFLRFAVVGGLLALALMVPAYEVVIEFGVAMALIVLAVSIARRSPAWRARWSIETALLAMVVAAVSAAAVGAAPTYNVEQWIRLFGIGFTVAYFALVCLWVVCGRARRRVRVAGGIAAVVSFVAVMHLGDGVFYGINQAISQNGGVAVFFNSMATWFRLEYFASWMKQIVPTVAMGVGLMLVVIATARACGWFTVDDDGGRRGVRLAARTVLCVLLAAVAAPNLYVLYRLCTPPELPREPLPAFNAYDDLIAVGKSVAPNLSGITLDDAQLWSDEKLREMTSLLTPMYVRIEDALRRPSWATTAYLDNAEMAPTQEAVGDALLAYEIRLEELRRRERYGELAHECCTYLRLSQALVRGQRAANDRNLYFEGVGLRELQSILGALDADECRKLATALRDLDASREPWERRRDRQRAFDYRSNWPSHLQAVLAEWSSEPTDLMDNWHLQSDLHGRADLRLLIVGAALHAYLRDYGELPENLHSLVPDYLAEVPLDPWDGEPLRYRRVVGGYRIYSVGWDGKDHGGKLEITTAGNEFGDVVRFGPRIPPMQRAVKEGLASAATRGWKWLKAAAAAAEKAAPPTAN